MKIKRIVKTSNNPAQWQGVTENNEPFFINYRWGNFSMSVAKEGEPISAAVVKDCLNPDMSFAYGAPDGCELSFENAMKLINERLPFEDKNNE